MFNSNASGYSLADIAAATGGSRNGDGGWGADGGAWWIIILFLFVFCGWGNGNWGGGGSNGASTQGALTRGDLCMDMNFNDLQGGVRAVNDAVNLGFANLNSTICNQQYDTAGMINGVNSALAAGFAGVDNAVCTLGYQQQMGVNAIQQAINGVAVGDMQNTNAIQTQIAQCCCDNKAALADVKYTMATDACAIQTSIANSTRDMIDNQNANTRSILDFLVQDKISTLQAENESLRLAASQQAQNNYLVNALRPAPVPAFAVPAPYQFSGCGNGYGFGGCGCAC